MDILLSQVTKDPPRMSSVVPSSNPALDAPVLHMMAKEPEKRPPSVGAALEALARAAKEAGHAVTANEPTASAQFAPFQIPEPVASATAPTLVGAVTESPAPSRTRRRLLVVGILGSVALAAAIVVAFVGVRLGKSPAAIASAPALPSLSISAAPSSAVPTPKMVEVTIAGAPDGADILVDGNVVGTTPRPIALPAGSASVRLTVKAKGFNPADVDVVPSKDTVVSVTLTRPAAKATGTKHEYDNPFGN